jgi:multiple sugar transport system permease protein
MLRKRTKIFISHFFIILIGLGMMYPLLWMVSASIKTSNEIFQGTNFFPQHFNFDNYVFGWQGVSGVAFGKFLINSIFLVAVAIVGNVCSCLLASYAFARLEFPLKKMWFAIMIGTLMLPLYVKIIPQYIIFNNLHWVNTYLPLLIPRFLATDGFFIFLMTQFIRGLPHELDEAATVDGCGPFQTFFRIIAPLTVPAIITTAIFTFIWTWNDFFSQMIYLSNVQMYTVSVAHY